MARNRRRDVRNVGLKGHSVNGLIWVRPTEHSSQSLDLGSLRALGALCGEKFGLGGGTPASPARFVSVVPIKARRPPKKETCKTGILRGAPRTIKQEGLVDLEVAPRTLPRRPTARSFRFSILATHLGFPTRAQHRHHALTPRDPIHPGWPALAIDVDWRRRPIFPRTLFVMNTEPDGRSAARGWPRKSRNLGTAKEFIDTEPAPLSFLRGERREMSVSPRARADLATRNSLVSPR
jgi:hypothetical protein